MDLIVYDTQFPVLFKQGDFVILTPDSVKGIIEVKSNIENSGFKNVIEKCNVNERLVYTNKQIYQRSAQ